MERFFKKLNTVVILTLIIFLSAFSEISAEAISTPGVTSTGTNELSSDEQMAMALANTDLDYTAHVQNIGWQADVKEGQIAGTTGQGLGIEAVTISLQNSTGIDAGSIEYTVHCQNIGWTPVVRDGEIAGTTGQGLKVQAACINLTGKIAEAYDVYYRVHSSYYGWLDWTCNGQVAGTTGLDTPAEAIEITLVRKGMPAPGETTEPNITRESLAAESEVAYTSFIGDHWGDVVENGNATGTVGMGIPLRGLIVNTPNKEENSSIEYKTYFSNVGWLEPTFRDGEAAACGDQELETIAIALKGLDDYSYDLYYQVQVSDLGWLGWASDGQLAGTQGGGKAIEAIRMIMLPRGSAAPEGYGTTSAFQQIIPPEIWRWPLDGYGFGSISSGFGYREGSMHDGIDILAPQGTPIKAAKSGTVVVAGWYYGYGQCVVVVNDTGEKVYYAHMSVVGTSVGAHVDQGQVIGLVGMTGNATANHLHLGVVVDGNFINPVNLF